MDENNKPGLDERLAREVEAGLNKRRQLSCGCVVTSDGLHPVRPDWVRISCVQYCANCWTKRDLEWNVAKRIRDFIDDNDEYVSAEELRKAANEAIRPLDTKRWSFATKRCV